MITSRGYNSLYQMVPKRVLDESRRLYTRIQSGDDNGPLAIGVTSAIGGEGKTTVALGLALAITEDIDDTVWLVELDTEHASLSRRFRTSGMSLIANRPRDDEQMTLPRAYTVPDMLPNLLVSTADQIILPVPYQISPSRMIKQMLDEHTVDRMKAVARLIVFDLPPLNVCSYGSLSTTLADRVVLVVRANITPAEQVKDAIAGVENGRLAGVVLNGTTTSTPGWLSQFF